MSYSLSDLIAKFRSTTSDTVEPYLWSDSEITDYVEEAEDEFCDVIDAVADVLTVDYLADDVWLDVPEYVTRIRRAKCGVKKLALFNDEQWDTNLNTYDYGILSQRDYWETDTDTQPYALITDTSSRQTRMYPIPTENGSVELTVYRRPKEPLTYRGGILDVSDRQYQRCILLKVIALGYLKNEEETYDPKLAANYDQKFYATAQELKTRTQRKRRRAGTVAYGGL